MAPDDPSASRPKPTVLQLGVDPDALEWHRSGTGEGAFEVAFVREAGRPGARVQWVLLRVDGDPSGRVLVYDRVEWACFVDGARGGEFDAGRPGCKRAPTSPAGPPYGAAGTGGPRPGQTRSDRDCPGVQGGGPRAGRPGRRFSK